MVLFDLLTSLGQAPPIQDWSLHFLTEAATSKGAVCLDGSPQAFYLRAPLSPAPTGKSTFVIFMEGGGWCGSDGNCYSRSLGDLGSSKGYSPLSRSFEGTGLFDDFPHANVVYAKYCDGGSFTGDVEKPVVVQVNATFSSKIYYRGRRNFDALFDELFTAQGLDKAAELLFAGCSAGALTTYVHADYVTSLMAQRGAPGVKTVALADAMFSLHHDAFPAIKNNYYTDQFTWGFTAWNSAASVNSKCLAAQKPGEQWFCFHGAIAAQYVKTPLFVANSKHDTWQVRGVLGMNTTECPGHFDPTTGIITLCNITMGPTAVAEEQFWEDYGDEMVAASAKVPLQHSFFLTNCPTHCQTAGLLWAEPAFPGTRLDAAVLQWYPEAIANVQNATWKAPRWLARHGDGCKVSATATQSS